MIITNEVAAVLMGTAGELWQFADPESEISKRYRHALETVVSFGARITVSRRFLNLHLLVLVIVNAD